MSRKYQLYKDLDVATEAALRASIERFGVLVPIVKDQHGNVLDGHQRARIAGQCGVVCPERVHEVADEAEAREVARTLNEDRRAMPKAERLPVVAALKADGHSNVAIGKALGVSEHAIRQDLDTLQGSTMVEPDRVQGLDGKSYPSHRPPKPAPQPGRRRDSGMARPVEAGRVLGRVLSQLRGVTIAVQGCDFEGSTADVQALTDLTACIRALTRLRRQLQEGNRVAQ